ncbi:MAG: hypothetical protein ABI291_04695 [Acidobacteriaceae bacterium]
MVPKNMNLWLPGYLRGRMGRLASPGRPAKRLWVAMTDHFEPLGGGVSLDVAHARVNAWKQRWPSIAQAASKDADGRSPCFTFFYPQEEYERSILNSIAELCQTGLTDVEVHLHHDHDTASGFREKVRTFCDRLSNDHGLLHEHDGRLVFGFIHGNWALDNSRPDGRWCGVSGELQVLRDLGCYADFTMPSLPSATQSRILNQIYWTTGDSTKPRGFDTGVEATPGGGRQGDLLMITGPTGVRFRDRLVPRTETGELSHYDLPTPYRIQRWLDLAPRIGDDIFVKLYGHSAREDNAVALLGSQGKPGGLARMFDWIDRAARAQNLELHWASAYRMFQAVERILQPAMHETEPLPVPSAAVTV